ncbi:MAG: hypothetical protein H0U74_23185 [Bradymonadaceae bacterium]|nr:hypothetical protein [Lujinxingiaceae bacterium]
MQKIFHNQNFTLLSLLLATVFLVLVGCTPEIGDACERSAQCPAGAICDNTVPGGYCTISNCAPNACPDEAICIEFGQRTNYCMRWCESQEDCREGQSCVREAGQSIGYCYLAD